MGQGLTGGPGTYARLKDLVTGDIPEPFPEPALRSAEGRAVFEYFVDDDLGGADTRDQLARFMHHHYFPRITWSKLTLNPEKSKFFVPEIDVLGFTKSLNGIRPSADKVAAIRDWPTPTNEEELFSFLYMLPYLRTLIPGRADHGTIMKSAIKVEKIVYVADGKKKILTKKMGFEWGETQQAAFEQVKKAIVDNVLVGGQDNLQYHLATEREALAVVKCLEEIRWLVLGSHYPIKLYTDHQALVTILKGDDARGRIARWQYRLSEYPLEIIHVPGRDLVIADGLSRLAAIGGLSNPTCSTNRVKDLPLPTLMIEHNMVAVTNSEAQPQATTQGRTTEDNQATEEHEPAVAVPSGWDKWIAEPWYRDIVIYKLTGRAEGSKVQARKTRQSANNYVLVEGGDRIKNLLYREKSGDLAQCYYKDKVPNVLRTIHGMHGHFAGEITKKLTVGRVYWPTRFKDITIFCKSCLNCQRLGPLRPTRGLLLIIQLQPLDMIGIDYIGPFRPIALTGTRYVVIAVDYFSRFLFARAVKEATSANTLEFVLRCIVDPFGWPRAVYSDNGTHFTGGVFPEELNRMGVKHFLAPIRYPSSVGLAERYVQILLKGLRAVLQDDARYILMWDSFIGDVVRSANLRTIRVAGFISAQLLLGYNPTCFLLSTTGEDGIRTETIRDEVQLIGASPEELEAHNYWSRLATIDEVREQATTARVQEHDEQDPPPPAMITKRSLEEGDLVLLRRLELNNQKGRKLEPRWEGSYILSKLNYHGQSGMLATVDEESPVGRYHVNDLKLFVSKKEKTEQLRLWKTMAKEAKDAREELEQILRTQEAMEL